MMTLANLILKFELSGAKVLVQYGHRFYKPNELSLDQLKSVDYIERYKPIKRADGIYKIIYLKGDSE
jgi:hypothetical protein